MNNAVETRKNTKVASLFFNMNYSMIYFVYADFHVHIHFR
jgi:hypothetical protein